MSGVALDVFSCLAREKEPVAFRIRLIAQQQVVTSFIQ